jgi:hypothetical protein
MTYYFKKDNTYRVAAENAIDISDHLPAGNYIIVEDMFKNLYLEQVATFELPCKLYGNTTKHAARIINTYRDRDTSTGVMLSGEKGSGKTLLSKTVSLKAAELGYPTIIVNDAYCDDRFSKLMQDIVQPCVVLFDEFEKVYDSEEQEKILTLFDGVFPTKKLFILTCNDKYKVNTHMRNRPGRIFYAIDFAGLEEQFIREYCEDNLNNVSYLEKICLYSKLFSDFNFDMLKALVEDMNRYNEPPEDVLKLLNAKPENDSSSTVYDVKLESKKIKISSLDTTSINSNPLGSSFSLFYYYLDKDHDECCRSTRFSSEDIVSLNAKTGEYLLSNKEGFVCTLTRQAAKATWDYMQLF